MASIPLIESYGDYLDLEKILDAQHPRCLTTVHDETLFIVIHQAKELWFYQSIVELRYVRELIRQSDLGRACETLTRIYRIFSVLTMSWDVLATLPPDEFLKFRTMFKGASGLQSAQFREIEFLLGLRGGAKASISRQRPSSKARLLLEEELKRPSLWDETNRTLAQAGFEIPREVLDRKFDKAYKSNQAVQDAWATVYRDRKERWRLYRLGERLLDLSAALANWRSKHILTVERLIGDRPGTGGTPGVPYLVTTLKNRAFPELWSVRNQFGTS